MKDQNKWLVALHMTLCAGIIGLVGVFVWAGLGSMALASILVAVILLGLVFLLRSLGWFAKDRFSSARWLRITGTVILMIIVVLFSIGGLVYSVQDEMFFLNVDDQESRDLLQGKPGYSEIEFVAANGKTYHGMMYQAVAEEALEEQASSKTEKTPLIIYFGGNGECSFLRMRTLEESGDLQYCAGYSYMFVDYEGYGLNAGHASYQNIYEGALAVYDYAVSLPFVDENHIVTMGYSLGTGAAVYLAANRPVAGLILAAPYANGHDLYNNMLPVFIGPMRLLEKQKLPSDKYAPAVTCPTLIFASLSDEVVPYESSKRLSQLISGELEFITLQDAKHSGIFSADGAYQSLQSFLEGVAAE